MKTDEIDTIFFSQKAKKSQENFSKHNALDLFDDEKQRRECQAGKIDDFQLGETCSLLRLSLTSFGAIPCFKSSRSQPTIPQWK